MELLLMDGGVGLLLSHHANNKQTFGKLYLFSYGTIYNWFVVDCSQRIKPNTRQFKRGKDCSLTEQME